MNMLKVNFTRLNEIHQKTHQMFSKDVESLEKQLLFLSDENHRFLSQIKNFESEKATASLRARLYQKAYELKGEKIALASTLTERAINELSSIKGITPETLKERLTKILSGLAFKTVYWDGQQPLNKLIPQQAVSEDFFVYATEALKQNKSDWFEDRFELNDVIVSLVPYEQKTNAKGLFITLFDLSEAYSYAEQAERSTLNLAAVKEQEERFIDAKKKHEELLQQREKQARFIKEKKADRNKIFASSKNNIIFFTALNFTAIIAASLFLFWFLGTRKITRMNDWLTSTSRALEKLPLQNHTSEHNSSLDQQMQLNQILDNRLVDVSLNEIGELSQNINFLLETIQGTMVAKDSLLQQVTAKEILTTELMRQKERRDLIFTSVQSGLVIVNLTTGKITDINPAALDLFAAAKEDIIDRSYDDFFLFKENDTFCSLDKPHLDNYEVLFRPLNKKPFSVLRSDRITILDDSKTLISSLVNFEDIKKSREQLEQAKISAEQANRMKSEFLANMSHEIRTPLNGVIGMTQLLYESKMNTDQHRICQTIHAEADSLLRIINEILDLSKIEAGKMDLEYKPFSPRHIIEQITENLALRMPANGIEVLSFVPPEIPEKMIGDPGRLQQILTNLGNNALKFTQKGQIYIHVELLRQHGKEVLLKFFVEDTGIGIRKEKLQVIFDSFTQADGSTTRKYGGSGLGTTIAKQLVELMGGEIGVTSQHGQGSTFWFTLPFRVTEKNTGTGQEPVGLSGNNILVIDDNMTSRIILERYLNSFGCNAQLCGDPDSGLEKLQRAEDLDLVICDYNLPKMSGIQLVEHLRKEIAHPRSQLPVIILSSYHRMQEYENSGDLNIQGLLRKPVRKADLESVIMSALGLKKTEMPVTALPAAVQADKEEIRQERSKKVILLVEDYPTNQQIALRYLSNSGYHVYIAENGLEAVGLTKKHAFDLILMDIQMPLMDGYAATEVIREEQKKRGTQIPIIAMTAHASTGFREKCLQYDMDDYLSKPIRKESFINKVDQWLIPEFAVPEAYFSQDNASDTSVFDYPKALNAFVDDLDFLEEVVNGFIHNLEKQLKLIQSTLSVGDLQTAASEAHSIKGGAYNLYATRLGQAAEMLEKACSSENQTEAHQCLAVLREQAHEFERHISTQKFFCKDMTA
ncbi:MAG: response regulator [Desulfuromonadales bacterium]|nr:response regulator [Desulfuromonadales bacterium]MBN2791630.1 response regulator [Desulfuromonadales bacterium]